MTTATKPKFRAILRSKQPTDSGEPGYAQGWDKRHRNAWRIKAPIAGMLISLADYADAHQARFESSIGEDYILGDAWRDALRAVSTMLNGELHGLDGGTCSSMICAMFERAGFDDEGNDRR